ncbi:GEVED domain-containing protein [Xanthomarina spongicola]|uniref:Putative secreted protein (Por secretion system target) n=1 Tax=Xanthomarina spongicola TaxID=570520 RepID=A0A316DHD0_9FLAO|nr:GEVED domain-containing protein [Xanthomarina spongicola]PWK17544.1 putative secreted protein (Por secretion system target) [Xanthomarina spongicola]
MKQSYSLSVSTRILCAKFKIYFIFITLLSASYSFGQTPSDDCSTAIGSELTVGSSCTTTAWGSSNDTDYWDSAAGCNATDRDDAWGWFTATSTTTTITYSPNSRDAILTLFTGTCSPTMAALACADDNGNGGAETITYATTPSTVYKVRIQRYNHNGSMSGNICIYSPVPPSITSLSTSSGCVGSSLTITGTNLTGASSVTIGGTAATITGNTATTVTVTVGSGTTGTVSVTTGSGSATSAGTFTVNPLPADPVNPNSNSPQCNPTGVTLSRVGSPPSGITWYWQTTANGTSTTNSGATYVVNTSGTYYLRAQNNTTGCWSNGSGSRAVIVNNPISTVVSSPSPANGSTGICYAGSGIVSNLTWTAAAGATSYDVYFGAGSLPGSITANVATNSYAVTLAANTTYYWRIVPRTACGVSSGSPTTWSFTTKATPCYCIPNFVTNVEPITNVNFVTINNTTSEVVNGTPDLEDFTATISTTVLQNTTHTITVEGNTDGNFTDHFRAFIDWNQNGDFTDLGESTYIGSISNSTGIDGIQASTTINVPLTASVGSTVMRIMKAYGGDPIDPCTTTYTYGQAEDYTIIVATPLPCVTPITQPTNLTFSSVTGNSISGSFTAAAAPGADNYLVLMNTTGTTPTAPSNGTSYTIGDTSLGATVVDNDNNTAFTATGLTASTTYHFFVYAFNTNCTGGPLYNINFLSGSQITGTATYCTPSVSSGYENDTYIRRVDFVGTLKNTTNSSTYSSSPTGYQDFSGLPLANISQQAQGEGVNVYAEYEIPVNPVHVKAWVDWNKNGDFTDSGDLIYDTDNQTILSSTFGFVIPSTQPTGFYRLRIRASESGGGSTYGPCGNIVYWGETEDYLFEVVPKCTNIITSVTDGVACGSNQNVLLEFEGSSGITGFNIYANETGGSPLTPAPTFTGGTNPTGTWTTPAISSTTSYWVTAINGCESLKRTEIIANIKPIPTLNFTPSTPLLCGEDTIVEITAFGDKETVYLIDEDFEGTGLGSFTSNQYSSGTSVNTHPISSTEWTQHTSTYIPTKLVWFPAIASDFGANKFVMSNSDINARNGGGNPIPFQNELRSATVSSIDYLNLTLKFDMYYSDYYETDSSGSPTGDYVTVRVSRNGGSTWTTERLDYNTDVGVGTKFERLSLDLSSYINEPNLVISFYYHSNFWSDGVALDNIQLFGEKPLSTNFDWSITADAYTDASATTPYISGTSAPVATIYVKPTPTQLENTNFTFTATAILSNGCSASTDVSIANNTKYFKGPNNSFTNWNDPNNWKPIGVPTSDNCVIVSNTYTSIIDGSTDGDAKNVTVKNGGTLTIQPKGSLTIVNFSDIRSGGTFEIENEASLIQIDNVINTGQGEVKRNSANVRDTDYIYWSSPIDSYDIAGISPTTPNYLRWQWIPTLGTNTNGHGDWTYASGNMTIGKGYIVRAGTSNSDNTADTPVNTIFRGVFNNGNISMPITSGTYDGVDYTGSSSTMVTKNDDNWNLIGNPYPSAINAIDFLNANTNIEGAVHIWTHGTQINTTNAPPFYEDYEFSYNINDYLTYNASGASSGAGTFGGNIASGQGFFVMMNHGAADTDVNFNNNMRHKSYDNSEFYRTQQSGINPDIERHRIWLSIISPTNQTATSLVGYIEGATQAKDRMFDAYGIENNAMNLFSLIEDERMLIQGRPLPFNTEDQIPIGAVIPIAGNYTIAIHSVDGLFEDETQDIYLEDLELNIIHNLRDQPYSFNVINGVLDNRFVLRYTNNLLSVEQQNEIIDLNITAPKNNYIKVTSTKDVIKNIEIFDLLGRVIFDNKNILKSEVIINDLNNASGALVVKVTLANGLQKTQKVILK